jgi:hypothetical protein
MTTQQPERFKVVQLIKFGMLIGYGVKDIVEGKIIASYEEEDKYRAESKCRLKNALYA